MNATTSPVVIKLPEGTNLTKAPKKAKKIGVVGVSKAENVQLGLILKEIGHQFNEYKDGSDLYIPCDVIVDPEALIKLIGRYQVKS